MSILEALRTGEKLGKEDFEKAVKILKWRGFDLEPEYYDEEGGCSDHPKAGSILVKDYAYVDRGKTMKMAMGYVCLGCLLEGYTMLLGDDVSIVFDEGGVKIEHPKNKPIYKKVRIRPLKEDEKKKRRVILPRKTVVVRA